MRTLYAKLAFWLIILTACGVGREASAQPAHNAALIERGRYLVTAADCAACHTGDPAKPFAGGVPIPTPFGQIFAPNITPDLSTGIGAWTDEDFYRAMHEGVGKEGQHLYPAFPYDAFTKIAREDVLAIKAYLFSLPSIRQANKTNSLAFPFGQRWLLSGWKLLNFREGEWHSENKRSPSWNRGAYLVEALAHCGTCHTPRNFSMGSNDNRHLAGGIVGSWTAPNITPDPVSGIGGWSDQELVEYLSTGLAKGKSYAAGGMSEAIEHSLSKLPQQDLRDIVVYLRTQPSIRDSADTEPRFGSGRAVGDVTALRGNQDLEHPDGRTLYYGACASCHGMRGTGTRDGAFPPLFRNTTTGSSRVNNLVMVILDGVHRTVGKETIAMPAFRDTLSSAQIALVANYVLKTYGNAAVSKVDAATVDTLRESTGEKPLIASIMLPGFIFFAVGVAFLLIWMVGGKRPSDRI